MVDFSHLQSEGVNWRQSLRQNERRTIWVILLFVLLYLAIGFVIDVILATHHLMMDYPGATVPPGLVALNLLQFKIFPYATITMGGVAAFSLWITYTFYDRIMLLGTEYHQVTPDSASSLEEKQLYNTVEELRIAAGLKFMPRVYVIEANYMNAFASGYSERSAMVAITRGLLEKLNRSELQAVMAHELSHIRHHDIKLTLTASVLANLLLIAIDIIFYSVIYGRDNRRMDGRLMFLIIALRYILPLTTVLLTMYLSRTREYMADAGCVELMRDNQPLASALIKIHQDYQVNQNQYAEELQKTPHEGVRQAAYLYDPSEAGLWGMQSLNQLFSSHPPLAERLKAIGFKIKPE